MHLRMLDRVLEADFTGVQAYAPVGVRAGRAVLEVALYGAAYMSQLAAYLVVTPGKQFHFYQLITFRAAEPSVIEFCQFCSGALCGYVGLVFGLVFDQPVLQMTFGRFRLVATECPIGFVRSAVTENHTQPTQCLAGLGEYADSAYRPVQTVGDTQEHLPGLVVACGYECLVALCKAFVPCFVSLGNLAALFVHDENVIVFVQDTRLEVRVLIRCQLSVNHGTKIIKTLVILIHA